MVEEREFIDECPSCGTQFLGMTPDEFRETHAKDKDRCTGAPYTSLYCFPTEAEKERLRQEGRI